MDSGGGEGGSRSGGCGARGTADVDGDRRRNDKRTAAATLKRADLTLIERACTRPGFPRLAKRGIVTWFCFGRDLVTAGTSPREALARWRALA